MNLDRTLILGSQCPWWTQEEFALLQTETDEEVAAQIGRSVNAVGVKQERVECESLGQIDQGNVVGSSEASGGIPRSVGVEVQLRVVVQFDPVVQADPMPALTALQTAHLRQRVGEGEHLVGEDRPHLHLHRFCFIAVVGVPALRAIQRTGRLRHRHGGFS